MISRIYAPMITIHKRMSIMYWKIDVKYSILLLQRHSLEKSRTTANNQSAKTQTNKTQNLGSPKSARKKEKKFTKHARNTAYIKNEVNRIYLLKTSKLYKQPTKKAYNDYQFQLENKLRKTSKCNSKEFWKIVIQL